MRQSLIAALSLCLFACNREAPPPAASPPPPAPQEKSAVVAASPHEAHEEHGAHEAHAEEPEPAEQRPAAEAPTHPTREQAARRNPLGDAPKVIAAGKALYAQECASCHGADGRGDGPEASKLGTKLADLNGEAVAHRSDGTLEWRLAQGGGEMPAFAERLTEQERWQVVAFLRSRIPRPPPEVEAPVVKK